MRLTDTTREVISELEYNMRNDRMMLRMLAGILAEDETMEAQDAMRYMSVYESNASISRIGLLKPDGTLMQLDAREEKIMEHEAYRQEAAEGEHYCGLQDGMYDDDHTVVHCYVPVRRNGTTVAMLFGETKPSNIMGAWVSDFYGGLGKLEIVDRQDGRIIVSSEGREGEHFADLEYEPLDNDRQWDKIVMDIVAGGEGYGAFRRMGEESYEYFCYMPMELANWSVVIRVPHEAVLATAISTETNLCYYLLAMSVFFGIYFMWMLSATRNSISETERKAGVDSLTGTMNRNNYEEMIRTTETALAGLGCIYVDINGLHELNNTKGHLAGDQMLQYVADQLRGNFGSENVYRVGGDEFIVFCLDRAKTELVEEFKRIKENLAKHDYHISVGIAIADAGEKVKELVRSAETRMFIDKRAFYENHERRMR
ncbi:MAG: sensor domain-containing diguanylate cyclase [Lachnospiraceae bacterium]|nr:sensor domain-containing diguanylate cyclase [Lachnospiraceae bacterium]